ncbi:hypothetical protein B0H17DRAFT_1146566, partial [Mycena rosella]
DLADEAETALSETLQDLQSRGVLQKGNSLSVEALVDVPEEQVMEDATDEEIFEAVQNMRMCRQDMEINGGDDNQDDHSPEPKPTRKEALHAMATLRRYLEMKRVLLHAKWRSVWHHLAEKHVWRTRKA